MWLRRGGGGGAAPSLLSSPLAAVTRGVSLALPAPLRPAWLGDLSARAVLRAASAGEEGGEVCGSTLVLDASGLGVAPPAASGATSTRPVRANRKEQQGAVWAPSSAAAHEPSRRAAATAARRREEEAEGDGAVAARRAAEAASLRTFGFLQLASSRLVLNQRRQPTEALLRHTASAARLVAPLRPAGVVGNATAAGGGRRGGAAEPPPVQKRALPPPPSSDPRAEAAELALSDAAAAEGRPGGGGGGSGASLPELILLLRDAQLSFADEGELVAAWLEGASERDAAAVRRGFGAVSLQTVGPPSEVELEMLSAGGAAGPPVGTAFGDEMQRAAAQLLEELPPLRLATGRAASGLQVAAWLDAAVRALNEAAVH